MEFLKDISIDKIRNVAEDVYNQAKPKTELEAKVYDVLSHKNWGASSTLLNEIARDTYDHDKFPVITRLMWEGMDNRPAAWRVVFKSLTLLEHLIKNGSERCVDDARYHSHQLRSLENFNYYEGTTDRGIGVREKAKQIVELLGDDERVREERTRAKQLREKFGSISGGVEGGGGGYGGSQYSGYGNSTSDSGGFGKDSISGGGFGKDSISGGGFGKESYSSSGIGAPSFSGGMDVHGFSGRYSDKNAVGEKKSDTGGLSSTPTFASIPESKPAEQKPAPKLKKTKKKKKKESTDGGGLEPAPAPAPAPEVDLFSFDQTSAPPAATASDEFDAFASARTPAATPSAADNDEFDAFTSARAPAASAAFDAFGSSPAPAPTTTPDVFGSTQSQQQPVMGGTAPNDPFAGGGVTSVASGMQQMSLNSMAGGATMAVMSQPTQSMPVQNNISNGMPHAKSDSKHDDDDFGDFSDAAPAKATNASDPISKLINLDSLSKNKKEEPKLHEPVAYNYAAAQAIKSQPAQQGNKIDGSFAFHGIDGIAKPIDLSVKGPSSNRQHGQPIMTAPGSAPMMSPQMSTGTMGGMQNTGMMGTPGRQMGGMMGGGQMGSTMGAGQMGSTMGAGQMGGMMGGNQMGAGQMGGMMGGNQMGGMMGGNQMGAGQMAGMMGGNQMGGMAGGGQMGGMMGGNQMGGMMGGAQSNSNQMGGQTMGGAPTMSGGMGFNAAPMGTQGSGMMGGQWSGM